MDITSYLYGIDNHEQRINKMDKKTKDMLSKRMMRIQQRIEENNVDVILRNKPTDLIKSSIDETISFDKSFPEIE